MNTPFDNAEFTGAIAGAQESLGRFAETNGADIESVSQTFKQLAFEADTILRRAASIVDDVSAEKFEAVLSHLREHCLKSRKFQERRLNAAEAISQNVETEIRLLRLVMGIASRQEHIAGRMKALSMLTNIESIHINSAEGEFRLLAQELSAFSISLQRQTFELADFTERHKQATLEIWAHVSSDPSASESRSAGNGR